MLSIARANPLPSLPANFPSSWGQEKKSYQKKRGALRKSLVDKGVAFRTRISVMASTGMYLRLKMMCLQAACSTSSCFISGSGCPSPTHSCETKAALPIVSTNSTTSPLLFSSSCGKSFPWICAPSTHTSWDPLNLLKPKKRKPKMPWANLASRSSSAVRPREACTWEIAWAGHYLAGLT